MNGAALTEDEPLTTPALPDPENVASSASLSKLPCPPPLLEGEPCGDLLVSNVSLSRPSEFVLTPAASTMGVTGLKTTTACVAGLVSLRMVGASLAPVMVM